LATVASNTSLYELAITAGRLNGDGISPDMLVFPRPVLQHIRSHPTSLTSLSLSVHPHNRIRPDSEYVTNLLGFIALFPKVQRLSLEFDPRDEHKNFPELSRRLRLRELRFLSVGAVDCTEGELVTLLLGHKDTLEEAYFSRVDIKPEGGSWQSLLTTVRDELSVQVLTMDSCLLGDEEVFCRGSDSDNAIYLERFEIGGAGQVWTDTINGIVVGNRGNL
jgi:hypothetical protein